MSSEVKPRPVVLLTQPIDPNQQQRLARDCEVIVAADGHPDTLRQAAARADGLIVRSQLPADVFDHAPRVRAVVRHGVGLDMIPVAAATARGIPVANLPGSNTYAVAEYCIAALLHLRRRLAHIERRLREESWAAARPMGDSGLELNGSTCGIVGVGAIGGAVARIAQGFGMRVIGLTRRPELLPPGVEAVDKAALLERADALMLCCPLNDQTRGFIDADALARMKPTAVLVNVSRGPVMDTAAVVQALRAGQIGGAAMDVHDHTPLSGKEPVFDCPNLMLTPHLAGITATSLERMSRGAVDTLFALMRGERTDNVVNPEVFDKAK